MLWELGSAIGARSQGLTGKCLDCYAWQARIVTALALVVLAVFAELIHLSVGVHRDVALLALAPGGIGEMTIVAVALDLMFVAFITCCTWSR